MIETKKEKKKPFGTLSTFTGLGISITLHLVLFLIIGSVVIFEGKVPPVPFLGGMEEVGGGLDMDEQMPMIEEDPIEFETSLPESELAPPSENMEATSAASTIDLIVSTSSSPAFTVPAGVAGPSINTDSLTGNLRGSLRGKGPGLGSGGAGSLFGRSIQANQLGVVLDISGSAHAHLDKAFEEIDKNFPTAIMVMVVGCGMSDGKGALNGGGGKVPGKPRIVAYRDRDSEDKYNSLERSVPAQLEKFFRRLPGDKQKDMRKYLEKRDNLYTLYGADIHGANFAFDYLLDLNADAIYWFADFADTINKEIAEDLTKRLRRNNTEVIAHNFLGKKVRTEAATMAEATGGSTIELVPGK